MLPPVAALDAAPTPAPIPAPLRPRSRVLSPQAASVRVRTDRANKVRTISFVSIRRGYQPRQTVPEGVLKISSGAPSGAARTGVGDISDSQHHRSYRAHEVLTAEGSQGKLVSERSRPGSARSAFQAAQAASTTASWPPASTRWLSQRSRRYSHTRSTGFNSGL